MFFPNKGTQQNDPMCYIFFAICWPSGIYYYWSQSYHGIEDHPRTLKKAYIALHIYGPQNFTNETMTRRIKCYCSIREHKKNI